MRSDQVDLNGNQFAISALHRGLVDNWEGGIPSLLSHDFHSPIGWCHPVSLFLEPNLSRLIGVTQLPESATDQETLRKAFAITWEARLERSFSAHRTELERLLFPHLGPNAKPFLADCAAFLEPGLAMRVFPEVFASADPKHNLVPLQALSMIFPGVFARGPLVFFAHPYFRRALSRLNSLNEPFLTLLKQCASQRQLDARIALDPDLVGLRATTRPRFEAAYEWGPKYSNNLDSIPLGVARHSATKRQMFFHGISATDFRWHIQDAQRTFQCEELVDRPSMGVSTDTFGCRYVHSHLGEERPLRASTRKRARDRAAPARLPVHLDGAIRSYSLDALSSRLETTFDRAGRAAKYTKLWRVNGPIEIASWKELIARYFRNNDLVPEYFGADVASREEEPVSIADSDIGLFVPPVQLRAGDGVRVSVTYGARPTHYCPRLIQSRDGFLHPVGFQACYDAETLDLIKILQKNGNSVEADPASWRIVFADAVLNLPLIEHAGVDSAIAANATQASILELLNILLGSTKKRSISFSLLVVFGDVAITFSVAGDIADLVLWLDQTESQLPLRVEDVEEWVANAAKCLARLFDRDPLSPEVSGLLQKSGLLVFPRYFLRMDEYVAELKQGKSVPQFTLTLRESESGKIQAVRNGLTVAAVGRVTSSDCASCSAPYASCPCLRSRESGTAELLQVTGIGAIWAYESAWSVQEVINDSQ